MDKNNRGVRQCGMSPPGALTNMPFPPPFPPNMPHAAMPGMFGFQQWPPTQPPPEWQNARQRFIPPPPLGSSVLPPDVVRRIPQPQPPTFPMQFHQRMNPDLLHPPVMKINSQQSTPMIVSQTDSDKIWLDNFVRRCGQHKKKVNGKSLPICEARDLHVKAYKLLRTLKEIPITDASVQRISDIKTELDGILYVLSNETIVSNLSTKIRKRTKKRQIMKERRKKEYLAEQNRNNELKEKNKELDDWIIKQTEIEQNQKREKQVQKELDNYLQEVRQKRNKLQKSLELINAISKLRKARKESALQKGHHLPETHDKTFSSAHSEAKSHLLSNLDDCIHEEKSLKSFLVEQHKIEEDKIKKQKLKDLEEKHNTWIRNRGEILFGACEELDAFDSMWPIQELHKQSCSNLMTLTNTRQQWDQFVSNTGERIPTRWVEPVANPQDLWKQYIVEDTEG